MKKIYFLLVGLLLTASLLLSEHAHAQVPQSMSYQGVIRSSDNALVVSAPVGLKISILQGSDTGTPVYVETQTASTNLNGFVSFAIGTGTVVTGSFAGINWAVGPYFIKTEIDPAGGTNYSITGTKQTNSVAYGLYGKNGVQPGTAAGQMKYWNGSTWLVIEPILNTISKFQLLNGVPTWVPVTGSPTIGTATAGAGQATITYTAPANNGGAAITTYTATSSPGGFTGTLSQAGSGTITVSGLTNGTAYTFTVTATNASGTSVASAVSNSVTTYTIPNAPTMGTATAGAGQASITFNAPASNGLGEITSYTATSSPGGFTGTLSQARSGTITVMGLTNGTAYTFTVTATNEVGTSEASAASNSVTPRTVAGAPTIGTATAGGGQATIAFTAPVSNGGAAITSYTATSAPGGLTGTLSQAGSGTITVTGLTNGTAYTFTVKATNAAGASLASALSNSVTPLASVTIGTQVWTNKNLDVTTYSDGTVIPQVTDPTAWAALTSGAWCYYANITANGTTYGKLYNWYAVTDSRGLAPKGWHIPTVIEHQTLSTFLGGTVVAGGALKSTGTSLWTTPNTDATNSSGFSLFPGGTRDNVGAFINIGSFGYLWSSLENDANSAWARYMSYNAGGTVRTTYSKKFGFSVRCVRD